MLESDSDYRLNNSREISTETNSKGTSKKLKCIIILSLITTFIIITGVIVLLIFYLSNEEESEHSSDTLIGEINCIYDIKNISKETPLLGDKFEQLSSLEIYINNKKINSTTKYKFEKEGENEVKFEIYEDLNMDYMYQNILDLKSVTIVSTKNAKITSMKSTFENCQNIKSFFISRFNTSNIKSMSKLFYGTNISISDIEGLDTNNVKDMSFMFASTKVKELDFKNLNTNQVKNMSYMFYGSMIEQLDLSKFQTDNVLDMSHMFESCKNLKKVDLQYFKTNNVKNMNSMFANSSIREINLTKLNTSKVTDM